MGKRAFARLPHRLATSLVSVSTFHTHSTRNAGKLKWTDSIGAWKVKIPSRIINIYYGVWKAVDDSSKGEGTSDN